jgi:hypothetical protein
MSDITAGQGAETYNPSGKLAADSLQIAQCVIF